MKSFVCPQCGKRHAGLPTDFGFQEPDEVFSLSYIPKYLKVRKNADFCTLDESRFFLRGCLQLPFTDRQGEFSWGVWVEVSHDHHDVYASQVLNNNFKQYRLDGRIANTIPAYRSTLNVPLHVLLEDGGKCPTLWLPPRSRHTLAREQQQGISARRQHELLEACGFFEKKA